MRFAPVELSEAEVALRRQVRQFLATELPRGSFDPGLGMNAAKDPAFSRRLGEMGWLAMALPARYGGHDRTAVDRFIVVEELLRWGAPVGHHWVADRQSGPVIAKFGTEAQRHRFLPGIARGELSFCIGMSEPDSGSDLASLRTSAVRGHDGWILNGRKVWTTSAHEHDWIIVLCRTTPADEAPDRHNGMSQLIVDLRAPGVTATPIPFIDGSADFCEVLFEDVFVPDDLVLGEIGQGWAQNTSELAYERGGPDRWLSSYLLIEELLRSESDARGPASDDLHDVLGRNVAAYWVLHHLSLSVARSIDQGGAPAIESALVKEMGTRFEQDVVADVLAYIEVMPSMDTVERFDRLVARAALTQPSFTVRGGTNEVLRSVASKGLRPSGGIRPIDDPDGADPLLVDTVARLLDSVCSTEEVERSEAAGWSAATWVAMAEAGFPWVGLAESAGGSGGTLDDLAAILRAVGAHSSPVPIADTALTGGWLLSKAGLALPAGPVSIADSIAHVIDGVVELDHRVAFARAADRVVVLAVDDDRHLALSLRHDQLLVDPRTNLAGEARDTVSARVRLSDVEHAPVGVDMSQLRARAVLGQVTMAAGALAAMAQMTVDYTHERRQFGKPVATFQAVQQHLVTVAQSSVRARMAADIARRAVAAGSTGIEIAAARVVMGDAIALGARAAHQAHGAMGVTREYPLHHLSRRLWSWRHEWGTTTHWRRALGEQVHTGGPDDLFSLIAGD